MAEVRKHNPDDADGLGKLVRDALGERIRHVDPGSPASTPDDEGADDRDDDTSPNASALPSWTSEGQGFTF